VKFVKDNIECLDDGVVAFMLYTCDRCPENLHQYVARLEATDYGWKMRKYPKPGEYIAPKNNDVSINSIYVDKPPKKKFKKLVTVGEIISVTDLIKKFNVRLKQIGILHQKIVTLDDLKQALITSNIGYEIIQKQEGFKFKTFVKITS
jgi:hypothetical protein